MEVSEKIWVLEHKVNGKLEPKFEIFRTKTNAWKETIRKANVFVDAMNKYRKCKSFSLNPNECKAEICFGSSVLVWECHEMLLEDFMKGFMKNDLHCYVNDPVQG